MQNNIEIYFYYLYRYELRFMKVFIYFVLLTISVSYANEQKTAVEQNNTRVSVYLHPVSLYSSLSDITAIYYSTVEIPFSLSNSLIARPSLLNSDNEFRLGSDIGFRHYLARKGEGLYLQGQIGVFYYRSRDITYDDSDTFGFPDYLFLISPRKSLWLDVMGYVGHSLKFSRVSVFIDVGFGVMMGIGTETRYVRLNGNGLLDFNISIGIPFGAAKPVNAQEDWEPKQDKDWEPKQDNTRVSVYLHPASLSLWLFDEVTMMYSTIEIPFNLKQALIIKPSLVKGAGEARGLDNERFRQLKVGSDIGMRIYYDKKGEGFYWQMQTGAFYYDAHRLFPEISADNSIWLDIMGYSGYSWKFSNVSVFADIGIGLGSLYGNLYALDCNGKCFGFFPIIDANLGIGIPFF